MHLLVDISEETGTNKANLLSIQQTALPLKLPPLLQCQSLSTRVALQWRAVEPPALNALAPKFQESYKMKKDGHKVMSGPSASVLQLLVLPWCLVLLGYQTPSSR